MADVIRKATNRWTKGLVMDFSPENTRNEVLTHALNATLLTFNGNELSLLNDMGNTRVETAYLPDGYMPVGTCEYGGIIYIVSYNPLEDKSLIGCFPSPERNISSEELGKESVEILFSSFLETDSNNRLTGKISNMSYCAILRDDKLNPGDKFIITANESIYNEALKDLKIDNNVKKEPIIALNIVSIEDSGKITYLNSDVLHYDKTYSNKNYNYHILGSNSSSEQLKKDIDKYRNVVSSGYSVFKSKTSGKLAILAELIAIDSYSVTHSIEPKTDKDGNIISYKVTLHHEILPNEPDSPKLSYYNLSNSLGYLNTKNGIIEMFEDSDYTTDFTTVKLSDVFVQTNQEDSIDLTKTLWEESTFDFKKASLCYPVSIKDGKYEDVDLALIKLPKVVVDNSVDLPFIYDYTIIPCMSYGKLEHLAVSNTVDFGKLHDFAKSEFTTWRYLVELDLVRLTFGADIYDTYEVNKVDGILLEFYDNLGFVGSLLIKDKKSYSGVYTKLLQLNTPNFLGTTKVTSDPNLPEEVSEDESNSREIGKLQSNLIYGVKTYLRRTIGDKVEYIPKSNFHLLTMPLLNDYYYSVGNFNNIDRIYFDFLLTYKLEDSCGINPYLGDGYTAGYDNSDYSILLEYRKGILKKPAIDVTKVYLYKGTSKLKLEIGLEEKYSSMGFSYKDTINEKFSCNLKLSNNDATGPLLAYVNENPATHLGLNIPNTLEQSIKFKEEHNGQLPVSNLTNYMFVNESSDDFVEINYDFFVGYKVSVSDISPIEIQTTTMCALCHLDEFGLYNYQDFGIKEDIDSEGNSIFYSDVILYNSGTKNTEKFGVGKQIKSTGHILNLCTFDTGYELTALLTTSIGKLNTGDPLKYNLQAIPKLAFYSPHVHGIDEKSYVNIVNITGTEPVDEESSCPVFGSKFANTLTTDTSTFAKVHSDYPRYSSSLLTSKVLDLLTMFIPTIDYRVTFNNDRRGRVLFTGLTGEELTKFNKALLNTMKSVYAYNPDYSTMMVCKGSVSIDDLQATFISNIISTDAKLDADIIDYITLQEYTLKTYINSLNKYVPIDLKFGCNLEHCGGNDGGYLVSSITYKLPKPNTIYSDFDVDFSNKILIKQSDGSVLLENFVGTINKRALYGFDSVNNNLVLLNVANYIIDSSGELTLTDKTSYRDELFSNYDLKQKIINGRTVILSYTPKLDYVNLFGIEELTLELDLFNTLDSGYDFWVFCLGNNIIIGKQCTICDWSVPTIMKCTSTLTVSNDLKIDVHGVLYSVNGKNLKQALSNIKGFELEDLVKLSLYSYGEKLTNDLSVSVWQVCPNLNNNVYVNGIPMVLGTRYNWSNLKEGAVIELMSDNSQLCVDKYPVLIRVNLKHFTFRYKKSDENPKNSIINNTDSIVYLCFGDNYYKVNAWYLDALLRGTSICIDDLLYDPYSEHRLYIKLNLKNPNSSLGLFINYREGNSTSYTVDIDKDDYNKLRFYLGPCFTNDNLWVQ